MPASLLSAKIRGVRSYGTAKDKSQSIDFMPLTLIVGQNGTGKTTVIESLKFIISGEEPPHSDSRRNFIHTPKNHAQTTKKSSNKDQTSYACIEISFKNTNGEICIARREISEPAKNKSATPPLTSSYKIGKGSWVHVHKQEDWSKILPTLVGVPNQAILSNVILCHQEDNLWCMSDSTHVKQIFDKIFGCEQYKREIKHMDDEIRNTKKDVQFIEKDVLHARERVQRKAVLSNEIKDLKGELRDLNENSRDFEQDIKKLSEKKKSLEERIKKATAKSREADSLKQRMSELKERDSLLRRSLQPLLAPRREKCRKPLPPPQPAKKPKPDIDHTADDVKNIIEILEKMKSTIDSMPESSEVHCLSELVKNALERLEQMRFSFTNTKTSELFEIEMIEVDEEDDEEVERKEREERERRYIESIQANISDNLEQLEELKKAIILIDQQAHDDDLITKYQSELTEIEKEVEEVRHQRSMMIGSKTRIERELDRMNNELKGYNKANQQYSRCMGKLVCSRIILGDLEKLKACFLNSITNFHDRMILKINEVLKARWRQIYQGSDIDCIELVDEEINRGKDKKSYNYHMAMRKAGVRMRMREKSSTGQRALASIILRMTLAELFVKDCAFIALDEPTANLDLSNVQALARAIGAYVRRRVRTNANIQWIIITHDEQFLRALDEESSPYFYKICIDDGGYSKISKLSYSCVSESLPCE